MGGENQVFTVIFEKNIFQFFKIREANFFNKLEANFF